MVIPDIAEYQLQSPKGPVSVIIDAGRLFPQTGSPDFQYSLDDTSGDSQSAIESAYLDTALILMLQYYHLTP